MAKIDDMILFAQVVKAGGLAAAGRKLGLSPASMTARVNQIEQNYNTRLLTRNTRSIALTSAGERFYNGCLRVIAAVEHTEHSLRESEQELSGHFRISAPSDLGRQYIAPAIAKFVDEHPEVKPHLLLQDNLVNVIDEGIDIAIRYGNLPDSNLVSRPLVPNRRIICAAPEYLDKYGYPLEPQDLLKHKCLVFERDGQPLNEWFFDVDGKKTSIKVSPSMSSSDGEILRKWALQGRGITLKSLVDVSSDLAQGSLILLLDEYVRGFSNRDTKQVGLQAIYPSRQYQPRHVKVFLQFLSDYLKTAVN